MQRPVLVGIGFVAVVVASGLADAMGECDQAHEGDLAGPRSPSVEHEPSI